MADVPALAPDGTYGTVSQEQAAEIESRGGKILSPEEAKREEERIRLGKESSTFSPGETWLAGQHAAVRGVGEAFGVPLDTGITGAAGLFGGEGAKKSTREYLKHLDESNPLLSKWMGLTGNVQGAIGATALLPEAAGEHLAARGATGVASRMAYGGVENVVQSTTRDINEASLGDAAINGEKLLANAPKHFLVGAGGAGLFEGLGAGLSALSRKAAPTVERQASAAIGREVGEHGEAAVAAGERLGAVGSRAELKTALSAEQATQREAAVATRAGKVAEAEGRAGGQLQERMAAEGESVDRTIAHYDTLRQTVAKERETAVDLAERIGKERHANAVELGKAAKATEGNSAGKLTPKEFDEVVDTYLGVVGRKGDPATRWAAEEHLRQVYAKEMSATASATSEASAGDVTRLQGLASDLEKAHTEALKNIKQIDVASVSLEKEAERNIGIAGRVADKNIAQAQKGIEKEIKSIPKASTRTDVDPWIAASEARGEAARARPWVSGHAAVGGFLSAIHGNIPAAGAAILSSFAANRVRAEGNFLLARGLRALSSHLSGVDRAIQAGAASIVGFGGARAVEEKHGNKPAQPKFEDVRKQVLMAQGNPAVIESSVKAQLGPIAQHAPMTYASALATAGRAQMVLSSVLPKPQTDKNSLTPHLDKSDVSATQKYEFMKLVRVIHEPFSLFDEVKKGTVTSDQVEAVKTVYPGTYEQIRTEIWREISALDEPLPYRRSVHIGTLLNIKTNEVLDDQFQSILAASYASKATAGQPVGSKPRSTESKTTKQMMSDSQKVEAGES